MGYDGQVGWDTSNVKLDDSPISHSTVGYVGLKHMRVQWMVTPISRSTAGYVGLKHMRVQWMVTRIGTVEWDTRGNVVDSPTYPT